MDSKTVYQTFVRDAFLDCTCSAAPGCLAPLRAREAKSLSFSLLFLEQQRPSSTLLAQPLLSLSGPRFVTTSIQTAPQLPRAFPAIDMQPMGQRGLWVR